MHAIKSALKVDSRRKIHCRTRESKLRQQCAGLMPYQLSYIPTIPICMRDEMTYLANRKACLPILKSGSAFHSLVGQLFVNYLQVVWNMNIHHLR